MAKFQITSRAGIDFGLWEGETKAEALANLHQGITQMNTLDEIKNSPAVTNWHDWENGNMKRTYLNLAGYQNSFAGCRSTKVYWCHRQERIVVERGKGTTPRDFDASIAAVSA